MDGTLSEGLLRAAQKSGDEEKVIEKKIDAPLYPTSVINLYPVVKGLTVGAQYRFTVFDPHDTVRRGGLPENNHLRGEQKTHPGAGLQGRDEPAWT